MKNTLKKVIGLKMWIFLRKLILNESLYHKEFDKKRCIFIHIPKAAGTSIGEALFDCGKTGHYEWNYYALFKDRFDSYFKFAFVRNPYDRLVSSYFYLKQGGKNESDENFNRSVLSKYSDFTDFVINGLKDKEVMAWGHFKRQSDFIYDEISQKVVVDYLGYFENINDDYSFLKEKLNGKELKKVNPSNRDSFSTYYTEDLASIVYEHYKKDFELFHYEKNINSY